MNNDKLNTTRTDAYEYHMGRTNLKNILSRYKFSLPLWGIFRCWNGWMAPEWCRVSDVYIFSLRLSGKFWFSKFSFRYLTLSISCPYTYVGTIRIHPMMMAHDGVNVSYVYRLLARWYFHSVRFFFRFDVYLFYYVHGTVISRSDIGVMVEFKLLAMHIKIDFIFSRQV